MTQDVKPRAADYAMSAVKIGAVLAGAYLVYRFIVKPLLALGDVVSDVADAVGDAADAVVDLFGRVTGALNGVTATIAGQLASAMRSLDGHKSWSEMTDDEKHERTALAFARVVNFARSDDSITLLAAHTREDGTFEDNVYFIPQLREFVLAAAVVARAKDEGLVSLRKAEDGGVILVRRHKRGEGVDREPSGEEEVVPSRYGGR